MKNSARKPKSGRKEDSLSTERTIDQGAKPVPGSGRREDHFGAENQITRQRIFDRPALKLLPLLRFEFDFELADSRRMARMVEAGIAAK